MDTYKIVMEFNDCYSIPDTAITCGITQSQVIEALWTVQERFKPQIKCDYCGRTERQILNSNPQWVMGDTPEHVLRSRIAQYIYREHIRPKRCMHTGKFVCDNCCAMECGMELTCRKWNGGRDSVSRTHSARPEECVEPDEM